MKMFDSEIDVNSIDPDAVIGRGTIFTCLKCGATAPSMIFEDAKPPLPEGWQAVTPYIAPNINPRVVYLCPDCWKEANKPFSYSITINGKVVQPSKTITPFTDKKESESNDSD